MFESKGEPMKLRSIALNLTALALAAGLVACSDNEDTFSVSGDGIKGPVAGATVKVYSLATSTATDVNATCTNTADDGSYSCDIPTSAKGPFKVELSGGQYCSNENRVSQCVANGGTVKTLSEKLSTIAVASSSGVIQSAPITPFTTVAVTYAIAESVDFVTVYQELATNYGIDPNPTAAPDLSSDSRSKQLLVAISSSNVPLSTILATIPNASVTEGSVDMGTGSTTNLTGGAEADTTPAGGLGTVTEVSGTTGATTGATGALTGASQ
jgi:hypothetical protein